MKLPRNKPNTATYVLQSLVAVCIIAFVLILDLTTKSAAESAAEDGIRSAPVIEGFFYLAFLRNTGMAWGLFGNAEWFIPVAISLTFVVLVLFAVLIFYPDNRKNAWFVSALALMTAGTVGNLVDRLALGYVRDFLDFNIFGWNFPTFNFADVALVVGVFALVVVMIVYFVREYKRGKAKRRAEEKQREKAEAGDIPPVVTAEDSKETRRKKEERQKSKTLSDVKKKRKKTDDEWWNEDR